MTFEKPYFEPILTLRPKYTIFVSKNPTLDTLNSSKNSTSASGEKPRTNSQTDGGFFIVNHFLGQILRNYQEAL